MVSAKKADYTKSVQPSFEGRLGVDVLVVGFPLATDVVKAAPGNSSSSRSASRRLGSASTSSVTLT